MSRPFHRLLRTFRKARPATTTDAPHRIRRAAAAEPASRRAQAGAASGWSRRAARVAAHLAAVVLVLSVPAAASADSGDVLLAVNDLPTVIANVQAWIVGILFAIASLFLVYSGALRAAAGGDTAMVERSKEAFKNALIGYAAAVLAPVFLQILQGILGS
jgi:hypothetical protein